MFENREKTKKRTGFFGGEYEEHYDSRGNMIGTTKMRTGFFGNKYEEHYDSSGKQIGTTKKRSGFFGDIEDHYDMNGKKIGTTKERKGFFGVYEDHYDNNGNQTGTSEKNLGFFRNTEVYSKDTKKGCFLTTACVSYHQLPDHCEQLETLRGFRDSYMMASKERRRDVAEYYAISPGIVDRINMLPEQRQQELYRYIFGVVNRCTSLAAEKNDAECHREYKAMIACLQQSIA